MAACVLGFVVFGLAVGFELHFRQLRRLQPQLLQNQNTRNLINVIANDALEYSKTHPSIDPILTPVGVKSAKSTAATPAPAGKTGNK